MAAVAERLSQTNWSSATCSRPPRHVGDGAEQRYHASIPYRRRIVDDPKDDDDDDDRVIVEEITKPDASDRQERAAEPDALPERHDPDPDVQTPRPTGGSEMEGGPVEQPPRHVGYRRSLTEMPFTNKSMKWMDALEDARRTIGGAAFDPETASPGHDALSPSDVASRQRSLHHTRVDRTTQSRFRSQAALMERNVALIVAVHIAAHEPVRDTLTSVAISVDNLLASATCSLTWEQVVLVIECQTTAAPDTLWFLENVGLLQPTCFDKGGTTTPVIAHVFEITLDLHRVARVIPHRQMSVALIVRCRPDALDPIAWFKRDLSPAWVVHIPATMVVSPACIQALVDDMDGGDLDAVTVTPRPQSMLVAWFLSPIIASNAFGWVAEASLEQVKCARHARPHRSRLCIVRGSGDTSSWVTRSASRTGLARCRGPETVEAVFSSERNDKARQWIHLLQQWRWATPIQALRLVMSSCDALLWLLNVAILWSFVVVVGGDQTELERLLFKVVFTIVVAMQVPLVTAGRPRRLRGIALRLSLWIMPLLMLAATIHYAIIRGVPAFHAAVAFIADGRPLESFIDAVLDGHLADAAIAVSLLWYIAAMLIAGLMHGNLHRMAILLPHELISLPGRYLSAVPYSIGALPPDQRGYVAALWATSNAAVVVVMSNLTSGTVRIMLASVSLLLAVIVTYRLIRSLLPTSLLRARRRRRAPGRPLDTVVVEGRDKKIRPMLGTSDNPPADINAGITTPSGQTIDLNNDNDDPFQ